MAILKRKPHKRATSAAAWELLRQQISFSVASQIEIFTQSSYFI